MPTRCS